MTLSKRQENRAIVYNEEFKKILNFNKTLKMVAIEMLIDSMAQDREVGVTAYLEIEKYQSQWVDDARKREQCERNVELNEKMIAFQKEFDRGRDVFYEELSAFIENTKQ